MPSSKRLAASAILASVFASIAVPTAPAFAVQEFDPTRVLSDYEIRQAYSMSLLEISAFLREKGGLGKQYDIDPVDGLIKDAPNLIRDAAIRYRINPKYILALLQKESSIVETRDATQRQLEWATGYALCDGCRLDETLPQKYRGLAKQIDAGTGWMDWYMTNAATLDGFRQPGKPTVIDGTTIVPANLVTAGLYNYTPHLHGNELLWNVMQRWFGDQDFMRFPDGTLVRNTKNGAVALIQGGKFRPILKKSVLLTRFRSSNVVDLSDMAFADLDRANRGAPVRFADLSLVRTENGDIFLLIGASKRRIVSPEAFARIGFNPEEVEDSTASDIAEYAEGEPISAETSFPLGELLQDPKTGGVWYAESGNKRPLWDKSLLASNFAGRKVVPSNVETLASLVVGEPVRIADGTLVKAPGDPSVYLISRGEKRPFPTQTEFLGLGFRFSKVLVTSRKLLDLHPTGAPIRISAEIATATRH